MRHKRLRFDRHSVSGKERRLIAFNERGAISPGGSGDPEFDRYVRELERQRDLMKDGADRKARIWADRDFNRQVQEARARRAAGGTVYPIRNVQDSRSQAHLLSARAAGYPVQGNYVDRTETGRKELTERRRKEAIRVADARHDAEMSQYYRELQAGTPTWELTRFKESPFDVQRQYVERALLRNEPVPDDVLARYGVHRTIGTDRSSIARSVGVDRTNGVQAEQPVNVRTVMDRAREAQANERAVMEALKERAVARGAESVYWDRCYNIFLLEIKALSNGVPKGLDAMNANEWVRMSNEYIDHAMQRFAYWAKVATGEVKHEVRTPDEIAHDTAERQKQFESTQRYFDAFVKAYIPADEYLNGKKTFDEKKEYVMNAVRAINAFGSHLFQNFRGTTVPQEVRDAYHEAAKKTLAGLLRNNDEIVRVQIPADEEGIQKLLKLRTDLLDRLAFTQKGFMEGETTSDIPTLEWVVAASAHEKRYLSERGSNDHERVEKLQVMEDSALDQIGFIYAQHTDECAKGDDAAALLHAAEKELYFLQANSRTDEFSSIRLGKVMNRVDDPATMGYVQRAIVAMHKPLQEATDEIERSASSAIEFIRAKLSDIKREGMMLHKYDDVLTPALKARKEELLQSQAMLVKQMVDVQLAASPKSSADLARLATWVADVSARPGNAELLMPATQRIIRAAMDARPSFDAVIAEAENPPKDATPEMRAELIDRALASIRDELTVLRSVDIEPDRVAYLETKLSLIDRRITERQVSEGLLGIFAQNYKSDAMVDSFRRAYDLMKGEEQALKTAFVDTPDVLRQRLEALDGRKKQFAETLRSQANVVVKALNPTTSTIDDVERAHDMLRASIRLRLNEFDPSIPLSELIKRLPKKEYADAYKQVQAIDVARAAAEKRGSVASAPAANVAADVRLTPGVAELIRDFPDFQSFLEDLRQAYGGVEFVSYDTQTKRCTIKLPENGNDSLNVRSALRDFGYYWSEDDLDRSKSTIALTLSGIDVDEAKASKSGVLVDAMDRSVKAMSRQFLEFKTEVSKHVRNGSTDSRRLGGEIRLFNRKLKQMTKEDFDAFAQKHFNQNDEPQPNGISLDATARTIFLKSKDAQEGQDKSPEVSIPKTIGGYPVTVQPSGDIVLSRDGYELRIRATTDLAGYYVWDGSDDGYHITSTEGVSTIPNQDPLGFFKTLPEAIAALESKVGTKSVVDKMKEWKERNEQAMEKLATYFDADGSPTRARGWTRRGLNFFENGIDRVASIDFLRRDDDFLRFTRQSDVVYGNDQKTYASVEKLLADAPEFLKARELPSLASTFDHDPLTNDDRRVLDKRFEECVALPTEKIVELLKKLGTSSDAFDGEWVDSFRYRLLPRVATKDSRLLQMYASTWNGLRNDGPGVPASFTVDIQKAAKEIAAAKPKDAVTLRECGAAMEFAGNREAAKQLFEQSFELGDLTAGILLVQMHKSSPSEVLPYAKRCLDLAKKQGNQDMERALIEDITLWEKEVSAQLESTKQNGATPKGVSLEQGAQENVSANPSSMPSVDTKEESLKPMDKPADAPVSHDLSTREGVQKTVDDELFAIRQHDAFLTDLEGKFRGKKEVDLPRTVEDLEKMLQALRSKNEELEELRVSLNDSDRQQDAFIIDRFAEQYLGAQERLERALQRCHAAIDTDASIDKASDIFIGRYKQFAVESKHGADRLLDGESDASRGSEIEPQILKEELLGDGTRENVGLIVKAESHRIDERKLN